MSDKEYILSLERQLLEANAKNEQLVTALKNARMLLPEGVVQPRFGTMVKDALSTTRRQSLALHDADVTAKFIHYPDCWDTMTYPGLDSAIDAFSFCSTCSKPFGGSVKGGE